MKTVTMKEAKEIFGQDFLGPKQTGEAFNGMLGFEIPEIPFSQEDLERARGLNQFLILRTDKTSDGERLSINKMEEMLQDNFTKRGIGRIIQDRSWGRAFINLNKEAFMEKAPRNGWGLTSKDVITKRYFFDDQIEELLEYLKKVFSENFPKNYKEAVEDFKRKQYQIEELSKDYTSLYAQREQVKELFPALRRLPLLQLTVPTPSEIVYDSLVYFQNNNQRLLENKSAITLEDTSEFGKITAMIMISNFNEKGITITKGGWPENATSESNHILFSRRS